MTRFGTNMKITVAESERARVRALWEGALGCALSTPTPQLDVYRLDDGFRLGVFFTDVAGALPVGDQPKAPWLEILVDDPDRAAAAIDEIGLTPVAYDDPDHRYWLAPGGPVFRLARVT